MAENLATFLQWAKDNGAVTHPGIDFKHDENSGTSAIWTSSDVFDSTEDLIEVPSELTINPTLAEAFFGKDMVPSGNRNGLTQLLLAKLRFDTNDTVTSGKNLSEFFKPYLNILPSGKESGCPHFWDGDEIALLQKTDVPARLLRETREAMTLWHTTISALPESLRPETYNEDITFYKTGIESKELVFASYYNNPIGWTSFPAFLWAHVMFTSRGFPYFLGDHKARDLNEAMLLPVFDLLNHNAKTEVKWGVKDEDAAVKIFTFKTEQKLRKGDEIWNSYGPKTNEELLLGYGFVVDGNEAEKAMLVLQLPESEVIRANNDGLNLPSGPIYHTLTREDSLPENLITLFMLLSRLNSTGSFKNLRNRLEALQRLPDILSQKLEVHKFGKAKGSIPPSIVKTVKIYKSNQKQIFQLAFEKAAKLEKELLKQYKPLSFKTVFKNDKTFANSLLVVFGITSYEQLAKSDDLDRALILWIIRCANKKHYDDTNVLPLWINQKFQDIARKIKITKEDVQENIPLYKALFPNLEQRVPEIYKKGDWSIKNFIIAERVIKELCFTREASKEVFFIEEIKL